MTEQNLEQASSVRHVIGEVVSNKMDKTIVVRIERKVPHPLYKKYTRKTSKIFAHDENNQCKEGDVVKIALAHPRSKNKAWALLEVVKKADG